MLASKVIEVLQLGIEKYGDHELEIRNLAGDSAQSEGIYLYEVEGFEPSFHIEDVNDCEYKGLTRLFP